MSRRGQCPYLYRVLPLPLPPSSRTWSHLKLVLGGHSSHSRCLARCRRSRMTSCRVWMMGRNRLGQRTQATMPLQLQPFQLQRLPSVAQQARCSTTMIMMRSPPWAPPCSPPSSLK